MNNEGSEVQGNSDQPIGALAVDGSPTISAADGDESALQPGRVVDLSAQVDFLTAEIARYRELLEGERIRHATKLANQQLKTDARIDDLRRDNRLELKAIHDQYRSLMTERQVAHQLALSRAAAQAAAELTSERSRHENLIAKERKRRDRQVHAERERTADELSESHQQTRQGLLNELSQAAATIERLQSELATFVTRAQRAEMQTHDDEIKIAALEQRSKAAEERHQSKISDFESRLIIELERLEADRRRSAATLAEVLERSAEVAADADQAKSDHAAALAKAEHAVVAARQRSEAEFANTGLEREAELRTEYAGLAAAADERVAEALEREAEYAQLAQAAEERSAEALTREAEYAAIAKDAEEQVAQVLAHDGKREVEFAERLQEADDRASEANHRATLLHAEYQALANSAEERSATAIEREAQLEAVISDLQHRLDGNRS